MNPIALITGASRGIGRGIAMELARLGWDVAINFASNAEAAKESIAGCHQAARGTGREIRAIPFQADISLAADRSRLLESVRNTLGPIELLVNNAGIAPKARTDLLDADEASFDQLLATNLKGPLFLTQSVARDMIAAKRRGKIIFISSISAYTASVERGDYCVSKAGVAMLAQLFAARLAEHRIGVFEIRPGIIATDMTDSVKDKYDALIAAGLTPIRRWGTPEDVGRAVAAIARDLFPFSTGEVLNVDGGFHLRTL